MTLNQLSLSSHLSVSWRWGWGAGGPGADLNFTLCKSYRQGQAVARGSSGGPRATHADFGWGAGETLPSTTAQKGLEDIPGLRGP